MGSVSRRGLFGWIGAFAAAAPFMAHAQALPSSLPARFDLLSDALTFIPGAGTIKVGDVITFANDPLHYTVTSQFNG